MPLDTKIIRAYFAKLGLEAEIADIYAALHTFGPQQISELARRSGVERTRIYRLIDALKASGLVEIETHNKYSVFRASPIGNLQILISKKEQEVHELQSGLDELRLAFDQSSLVSATTRVQLFEGIDGIKQMLWNQTKSRGENMSILYENIQSRTKLAFFERWARACNEANLTFRSIVSDHFIESQRDWYGGHNNERLASWRARYVAATTFPIRHSTVIYDNVTAHYNWKNGEVFGLEITNQEIADSQRAFFEMLWQQGVDMHDLKDLGAGA